MRKPSIQLVPLLGLVAVIGSACGGDAVEEAPPAPTVTITSPADGATVMGPDVTVTLQTSGLEIVPVTDTREGTGHHHIFIDEAITPSGEPIPPNNATIRHFGTGATEVVLTDVQPGQHRLIAVVGDWQHVPIAGLVTDTINITVEGPPPTAQ